MSRIVALGLADQLDTSFQILNLFKSEPGRRGGGEEGVVQILEILELNFS